MVLKLNYFRLILIAHHQTKLDTFIFTRNCSEEVKAKDLLAA